MAISTLIPISKSLNVVSGAASLTRKTLGSISNSLSQKTREKKNINSSIKILKTRREQNTKRQIMQDVISAPTLVTRYKGPSILSSKSDNTSFTSRILGFIGYFSAGWILSNMPTWISIGEQFVTRINQSSEIIRNIGTDLINFVFDIGGVFNAAFSNLRQFDFTDSSGNLNSSLEELSTTITSFSNNLESALSILTQPFVNVPELGSRSERPSAYDQPTQPRTQTSSTSGKLLPIHKQALDIISGPESGGDYNAMNNGRAGDRPGGSKKWLGKNLTDMTIGEVKYHQNVKKDLWAAGRYQIVPVSLPTAQASSGLKDGDKFDKNNQDLLAISLLKVQGPGAWTKYSKYSKKEIEIMYQAKDTPYGPSSPSTTKVTPRPQTTPGKIQTAVIDEINISGPRGGTRTVGRTGGRGEYLSRGGRHKGIDIGTSGQKGYYVSFAKSGKVTYAGWNDGGYGYLVIIRSGNLEFFFAHLAKIMVKNNSPYNGETIGEIGNTGRSRGEHLHFEVRVVGGSTINPEPYLQFLSIGKRFSADFQGKETVQPVTPITPTDLTSVKVDNQEIQIDSASLVTFNKLFERLSVEQNKRKIVIIDDSKPSPPPRIISGGSIQSPSGVREFTLVNNFMKNKLLLDLTYL